MTEDLSRLQAEQRAVARALLEERLAGLLENRAAVVAIGDSEGLGTVRRADNLARLDREIGLAREALALSADPD